MHQPEWAMLIDLPTVTPILTSIFDSKDYITRGGGGDFCLPGAVDYQPLHSDMGDPRAWHGGTPNLSNEVRAIPNIEYFAPWYREPMPISMPRKIFDSLSQHGQWISRYIVAGQGEEIETGFRRNLGGTPLTSKSRPSR